VITVDCGVTDIAEVQKARKMGLDIVITDHHSPLAETPPAVAVVDAIQAHQALGPPPLIKWVNDILIDGRKVGGVLTASVCRAGWLEAAVLYQHTLQLAPDDSSYWNNLGWALANAGFFELAAPCLERALDLDPESEYARSNLAIEGLPQGEYLTVFGQYVVKPQIFGYLEEHIQHNVRERGEFQLTSALDRMRQEEGFYGLIIDGVRFDIGLPDSYLETLQTFRKV